MMHIELGTREDACLLAIDPTPNPSQQRRILDIMSATFGVSEQEQALFDTPLTEDAFEHIEREDGTSYSQLHLYYGSNITRGMVLAHRAANRIVAASLFLNEEVTVDRDMRNVQYKPFFSQRKRADSSISTAAQL